MQAITDFLKDHATRFEDELCELLRIPSVSTDSRHKENVRQAAGWMVNQFESMGLATRLIETAGHPIVFAESPPVEGSPVALVYGHYDVQPPDPLDEWNSPPFEPVRNNGNIVARGATDDKGQMLTHVKSVEAWLKTVGELPIQVKFLIEGEEEVGSENLYDFLDEPSTGDLLACDVVVISDTSQFAPGQPAITYGLKGLAYYELHVQGPHQDLHSGTFGGAVKNPANALAFMLASIIDQQGRVQIPNFYDDVQLLTDEERERFAALPFREEDFKQQLKIVDVAGEEGFTTLERRWARPTFDINGITSGYQGEGAKTVLPAKASAKFSFRLVPDQQPAKITEALKSLLAEVCPTGVTFELNDMHGASGVVVPLNSPYLAAASAAIEKGFGTAPVLIREGGSIPVVTSFKQKLNVDSLLLGWGLNDDNTHGPNEKFNLADFHRGIAASAHLWNELANL